MDLHVEDLGPRDAPAVVLLHGGGLSGRMWRPQIDDLARDHRVVVPDLPGQGQSRAAGPFALDASAHAVAALIAARVPSGRAHVVGLSLGGAVALTLMRVAPERVERVVVSGTAAGIGRVLGGLALASAGLGGLLSRATLVRLTLEEFAVPAEYHAMVSDDLRVDAAFNREVIRALMGMTLPIASRVPTLVAVGSRETFAAKGAARQLVRALPDARGVVAPDLGHVWNLQDPALFTAMIRAWLHERPLPERLRPLGD